MRFQHIRRYTLLDIITIIPGILLASLLMFLGVINLVSPDVPSSALGQNTRVCTILVLTAAVMIYTLFRPYTGGILLCACAVFLIFILHFHSFWSSVGGLVLLLGALSIIRGRLSRRTASKQAGEG